MSNFDISINGQHYQNLELRQVKEGMSLKDANHVLSTEKDGNDTIGVHIDGVDYLISGKGIKGSIGDKVQIDGQAVAEVVFIEQEFNTFSEGWKKGVKSQMKGIQRYVGGAPALAVTGVVGGAISVGHGMTANDKVLEKVTQGPVITPEFVNELLHDGNFYSYF